MKKQHLIWILPFIVYFEILARGTVEKKMQDQIDGLKKSQHEMSVNFALDRVEAPMVIQRVMEYRLMPAAFKGIKKGAVQ